MTDLAKRAVKCKWWRWMPGMLAINADGPIRIDGCNSFNEPFVWGNCQWSGNRIELWVREMPLPDFSDPATRGCLLQLVREAWGDDYITSDWTGANVYGWAVRSQTQKMIVWGCDTETAALVAALEAAPTR